MSKEKRTAADHGSGALVKRNKPDANANGGRALAVGTGRLQGGGALIQATPRTSGLQAPVMELVGHAGEVFCSRFDPAGNLIASGSMDRDIFLWRTYGQCENYGILTGHKGAVLDMHWSRDSRVVFSASADMMLASWDTESGTRIRRHPGHEEVINSMDVSKRGEEILVSGSDDGYIGIWDTRQKAAIDFIETDFPVTAVALSEAGNELYSGGIDNDIKVWDIRKRAVVYSLIGHNDTITSLRVSPDSQTLLSNSHDSTVRTWDIRPFAPTNRHIRTFDGAPSGMEKNLFKASWDPKGAKIVAGGGDGTATIWDSNTGRLLFKLPGHKGSVNDAVFSPNPEENILLTGSTDRTLLLGELSR